MKYSNLIARAAACAIFPVAALAQSALSGPALLDPTDAHAPVPPARYESPLGGYRPLDEEAAPADEWRSRNDLVGRTGSMSTMEGMDHGSMKGMDRGSMGGMDHGAMEAPEGAAKDVTGTSTPSRSDHADSAKSEAPSKDGTPGMNMPAGDHSHHQ